MAEILSTKNLFKIFGPNPTEALRMYEQGANRDSIFESTGNLIAVTDANLSIHSGEIFVVMGLSGSGKSTLVRMLNRLIEPTIGQVSLAGKDITKMGKKELIQMRRREMSMVFQSFALMPRMNVMQNAAFGLEVAGYPVRERQELAMRALEQVGLKAYAASYPHELSGGMQQRVGLARALAQDPNIMLMDEAFSALDPLIRAEMQDELLRLQEERQRTIVFISHDLDEAIRIGDRIAIMEGGRIVQVGAPDEILQNPADEYVRSFFRSVDPTTVLVAGDIVQDSQVTLPHRQGSAEGMRSAMERLLEYDREVGYVLDRKRHFQGIVTIESLRRALHSAEPNFERAVLEGVESVQVDTSLEEVLTVLNRSTFPVPVVDADNVYKGVISRTTYLEILERKGE